MSVSPSVRVLTWLFALGILGLTAPASSPDEKTGPSPAAVKKEDLRYDGKPFAYWQTYWRTELKAERRVECLTALAAFASKGYGEEAVSTILELMMSYGVEGLQLYWEARPSPAKTVLTAADETIEQLGPSTVPVVLRHFNSEKGRLIAGHVLGYGSKLPLPEPCVLALMKLVQSKDGKLQRVALDILWNRTKEMRASVMAATRRGEEPQEFVAALGRAIRLPDWDSSSSAMGILSEIGPSAKGALPDIIAVLENAVSVPKEKRGSVSSALFTLARLGSEASEATPVLIRLFQKSKVVNSGRAVSGGVTPIGPALTSTMELQMEIAQTLGRIGPAAKKALPVLQSSLADSPPAFSTAINAAIQQIRGEEKAPPLKDGDERY